MVLPRKMVKRVAMRPNDLALSNDLKARPDSSDDRALDAKNEES